MGRYKLLPALVTTVKDWRANNKRYSWLYCPLCKHDLNGDNESFLKEDKDYWYYKCSNCGCKSKWLLDMLPIVVAYQRIEGSMRPQDFKLKPNQPKPT
jgi:hypothetical protein